MAKELPYFKFEPNEWENGNIQMFSREDKGLFIDLCSMYWSRLGDLPIKLAIQKLCGGNASALDSLINEKIFTVIDGFVCINFLNEQLEKFDNTSKQNSKNAKEAWEKRRKQKDSSERNASASNPQCETDAIREEKRIEEEKKEENTIPTYEDFLAHGLSKMPDVSIEALRMKYESWIENDWCTNKDGKKRKIQNWKSTLNNTLPFLPKQPKDQKQDKLVLEAERQMRMYGLSK
jgi:hypothetical protein